MIIVKVDSQISAHISGDITAFSHKLTPHFSIHSEVYMLRQSITIQHTINVIKEVLFMTFTST